MSDTTIATSTEQPEPEAVPVSRPVASSDPKMYTEDDLAAVRQQEKDKMYKRLETLQETVKSLESESRERAEAKQQQQQQEQERQAAEQAALKAQQESEMSAKELLEQKEREWKQQLMTVQQQMEAEKALRQRESEFAALMETRQMVQQQYADRVAPELIDLIHGDTPEEIQQSAEDMAARTQRILDQTQAAMQTARQQTPTTRVSLPASGDNSGSQRQFTADELQSMSMADYAKHRRNLLGGGADGPSNRGLFG